MASKKTASRGIKRGKSNAKKNGAKAPATRTAKKRGGRSTKKKVSD